MCSILDADPGCIFKRFARAGWQGVGVDISPAAIDYSARRAVEGQLACSYVQGDFRDAEVDGDFDLVLCLFGELSTLPLDDVRTVLSGASRRLRHGGQRRHRALHLQGSHRQGPTPGELVHGERWLARRGPTPRAARKPVVRSRERLGRTMVGHRWDGTASSVTRHDDVVASDARRMRSSERALPWIPASATSRAQKAPVMTSSRRSCSAPSDHAHTRGSVTRHNGRSRSERLLSRDGFGDRCARRACDEPIRLAPERQHRISTALRSRSRPNGIYAGDPVK